MWDNATIMMLVEGTFVTLYMTLVSTFMGYVLGLPMGIALVITAPKGLRPNKIIYKILDVIVNIVRSIPFLILLIMIIPLTRIIVGKSYGPTATIVPLTLAAAPFIARMVESSLLEVDHGVIEAAQVPRTLPEVSFGVLNGNYAMEAGLTVADDALLYESDDSEAAATYVNVIAVKEGNENLPKIKALVDTLKSDEIKQFINDNYNGGVIPYK